MDLRLLALWLLAGSSWLGLEVRVGIFVVLVVLVTAFVFTVVVIVFILERLKRMQEKRLPFDFRVQMLESVCSSIGVRQKGVKSNEEAVDTSPVNQRTALGTSFSRMVSPI
jgi:hypothetical protein